MNYHEALGRYAQATEECLAARYRARALMNNLALAMRRGADGEAVDLAGAKALLDGAQVALAEAETLRAAANRAAGVCGKPELAAA